MLPNDSNIVFSGLADRHIFSINDMSQKYILHGD